MNRLSLLLLPLLLTACPGPTKATTTPPAAYDNAASAKDTTVTGQDNDHNGVRDDVQADIVRTYTGIAQQQVLATARAYQDMLNAVDTATPNRATAIAAATAYAAAASCIDDTRGFNAYVADKAFIATHTVNSDVRARAWLTFNDAIDGAIFTDEDIACRGAS